MSQVARVRSIAAVSVLGTCAVALQSEAASAWLRWLWSRWRGGFSVQERVDEHGSDVWQRLQPRLALAGFASLPHEAALLGFKDSRRLELHARGDSAQPWRWVHSYPVLGASGGPGPKLQEGDRQVPEGLYRIALLNPNSRFHLSMRLDYPNEFDRRMAQADGRIALGGDVMIHGTAFSVGCLAVGNEAAEDLFVLAAWMGLGRLRLLISPTDFRDARAKAPIVPVPWAGNLYAMLRSELSSFPRA